MRLAKLSPVLAALALAACSDSPQRAAGPTGPEMVSARPERSRVIVVFASGVADAPGLARRLTTEAGGELHFTYQHALKGFAATFPAPALEGLRRNPNVTLVEPDAEAELHGTQPNPPSWGLDRIDQLDLPLNASYTYPNGGAGVNVYILDTGVRLAHVDFGGRANYIPSAVNGNFVGDTRTNADDCHGHGTHVAGTAAGTSYGVAKGAAIWAGRVVNCQGSGQVSMAIAGVDWITANAIRPAVVNMSLGYGDVQSLRTAVENSITAGVNYAVSAGNGNFRGVPQNACQQSPGGAPNANTVGATASNDSEASFSNYGPCVDILAPGVSITSAWYTSNTASNTISGTSMSSPHVAGAIALYLAANPSATPSQVSSALKANATLNTINLHGASQSGGTANRFLYVGFIAGGGGNTPPTANFTFSCAALTCTFTDTSTDGDGTIATRNWNFGDGATSTATNPSHTYAAGGTFNVSLTVTDDDGAQDVETKPVSVSAGGGGDVISLDVANASKGKNKRASLTWSGSTAGSVDVYRNGGLVTTTANDGQHTDVLPKGAAGTFTYRICNAGTATCSNESSVTL
jgi:subtilisin family serine protease